MYVCVVCRRPNALKRRCHSHLFVIDAGVTCANGPSEIPQGKKAPGGVIGKEMAHFVVKEFLLNVRCLLIENFL